METRRKGKEENAKKEGQEKKRKWNRKGRGLKKVKKNKNIN